jgi:hypothetical protein
MAAPVTPEEWLPVLTKRLDAERPRIDRLRSYTNGDAPLPEAGPNIRAAWSSFQRKARHNVGELIVEAPAERIICNQLVVAGTTGDNNEARRIWVENRMAVALGDTVRDMLTVGTGYMIIGTANGRPVITSEKPEYVYAATDPLRPWIARAVVKVWRDVDAEADYAYVWANGVKQRYWRPMYDDPSAQTKALISKASGNWKPAEGEPETYQGTPPVVVFQNHDGTGEFEPHTDGIDRINKETLDRLVTQAMQAFRQRFLEGGLPKNDPETGEPIDYAAIFVPAPGAVWDLPEGVTLKETQESAQSIMSMLAAEKDDFRNLAAETRTPLPMLVPEGANQSAAGAEAAKEGLVMKTKDRIERIKPAGSEVMTRAMKVLNPDFDSTVELGFADPTFVTFAEKHEANVKAKAGDVPWRKRMIDILGYSADEVDEMQVEREEEQLATQVALAAAQPPAAQEPQSAPVAA